MTPTPEQIMRQALKEIADLRYDNTSAATAAQAALTAAAGVDPLAPLKAWDSGFEEAVKRCAQVMDELAKQSSGPKRTAYEVSAHEIRALKDKP